MTQVDMNRLGGLYWVRRTGGRLNLIETLRLLAAVVLSVPQNALGLIRLAIGWSSRDAALIDVKTFQPPMSPLALEAAVACAKQGPEVAEHSYRTWLFGLALAKLDGCQLKDDIFYCAALLHDYGLRDPTPGQDFTLASGKCAIECATSVGLSNDVAEILADAIAVHASPGISVNRDGSIGCYVQWGSMADVAGLRLCDISPANRKQVLNRHPRSDGFKREMIDLTRNEARAVPHGRFALLVHTGATALFRRRLPLR